MMNKFRKVISLALAAALSTGAVSIPVFASDTAKAEIINAEDAVSVAAKEDFTIENYPYSFTKTFDDDEQLKDKITYNESSKYKSLLSTRTSNPGLTFGAGYQGDAMIITAYSGHMDNYGGTETDQGYGNVADTSFTTKNEVVYTDPTTGASVGLTLSEATVGVNKVAFWTKAVKADTTDRETPENVTYTIKFTGSGASSINVQVPMDDEWHYIVADLDVPFSEGFTGINISSNCSGTFGSVNSGRPYLKLDGTPGEYPIDDQNEYIRDIDGIVYVLKNGEYVRAKIKDKEFVANSEGRYLNIPKADGTPTYHKTDYLTYIKTVDEEGNTIYVEDENGTYIYDVKDGKYYEATDLTDRYDLTTVSAYQVDESGNYINDENGDLIPLDICGNLVEEVWQTQIYIDEMLFYRTTESGGRTTFMPSGEEGSAYYNNTDLKGVNIDGVEVYNFDNDGNDRTIKIPRDFDLSDPATADRIQITTKCPDVIFTGAKNGNNFIPIDVSETGIMRSGSIGKIKLPESIDGKAVVSVISSSGYMEEYEFDLQWGYDLSVIGKNGRFDIISAALRSIEMKNYGDEPRTVQTLVVIRDKDTNELKGVVTDTDNGTTIQPGETANLRVRFPSVENPDSCIAYFYFYDSIYTLNQVASPMAIIPTQN